MTKQHHRRPAGNGNDGMWSDRTSSLEGGEREGGGERERRVNEEGMLPLYTDELTAAGGTYTLCTAPDSRSTVWNPLVEA